MSDRASPLDRDRTHGMTTGLLNGIRVLELGHFIAAPFCARVLADMGADVIKVEPPVTGDPVRGWGAQIDGHAPWWSVHGRNRRCITLNLRDPRARAIMLGLVASCDILVENFRPGQLEKWHLAPDVLAQSRPGIVVVRISGYGQTGPDAAKGGFGVIGEAKGGLRYLCAHAPEVSDLPSVRMGVSVGDSVSGLYGALGALAAVIEQRATGRKDARVIDVALGETVLSLLEGCLPEYSVTGQIRAPMGSGVATAAPTNAYRCRDRIWLLIAANSDPLFKSLCGLMGVPHMASDARFIDNRRRLDNVMALDASIGQWTAQLDAGDALTRLDAANIPASKIYTIADCASDAQYRARGMVTQVNDPRFGQLLHPGVVPMVQGLDRDAAIRWTGPDVGAHNAEVYAELLGFDAAQLEDLKRSGLL